MRLFEKEVPLTEGEKKNIRDGYAYQYKTDLPGDTEFLIKIAKGVASRTGMDLALCHDSVQEYYMLFRSLDTCDEGQT